VPHVQSMVAALVMVRAVRDNGNASCCDFVSFYSALLFVPMAGSTASEPTSKEYSSRTKVARRVLGSIKGLAMKMIMNRLCLAFAFVLTTTLSAHAQSVGSQDETAIKAQLVAYSEARQRGDGRTQASFYTEDAEIWLATTRKMSRGRAAIEKELNLPSDPNRRFRLEVENISFLNPEVAFIDAQYYNSSVEPIGHAFYVMVKREGKWLIRETRTARFVPSLR
jgi:uncharacterized protein (TIGR02246 family)